MRRKVFPRKKTKKNREKKSISIFPSYLLPKSKSAQKREEKKAFTTTSSDFVHKIKSFQY